MTSATVNRKKIQDPSGSSNKWFIVALAGIFVIGAAGVAILASSRTSEISEGIAVSGIPVGEEVEISASVSTEGTPLTAMPQLPTAVGDASNDPAIGQVAPTIIGTDFSGDSVTIEADGRGKAVIFLAHWCPHCQQEVPTVVDLYNDGKLPEGVDLYAVSTAVRAGDPNYPPNRWLAIEQWPLPVIRDSAASDAYSSYGAGGFPFAVYLDGENKVVARSAGELTPLQMESLWLSTLGG